MAEQHRVRREARALARRSACVGIGPNSPSISVTSWPASISGPPIASRPSGGRCSSGMRLPIAGCGTLMRRMRMRTNRCAYRRSGPVSRAATGSQAAKPAFAPRRRTQSASAQIFGREVGPHPFGEMQFGVGALPQQEVGQPLLAAGADEEIDVAECRRSPVTSRAKLVARELVRPGGLRSGIQDRIARRIVDGDAQMQDVAARRSPPRRARSPRARPSGRRSRRPITVRRTPLRTRLVDLFAR